MAVEDNKVGFYFSSIKADTRHPYITLCDASGSDIESSLATPARTHTVYPKTSETPLYLPSSSAPGGSEENKIKYQLNDGSGAKTIGVSTGVLTNAPNDAGAGEPHRGPLYPSLSPPRTRPATPLPSRPGPSSWTTRPPRCRWGRQASPPRPTARSGSPVPSTSATETEYGGSTTACTREWEHPYAGDRHPGAGRPL